MKPEDIKQMFLDLATLNNALTTIGIKPSANLPDYGYIEIKEHLENTSNAFSVNRFTEKPTEEKAAEFIATGNFYWNSGMFIFPINLILEEFQRQAPQISKFAIAASKITSFDDLTALIQDQYEKLMKISIDYCIMENAKKVIMLTASFDWDDIGNWKALKNHLPLDKAGNVTKGITQLNDCNDCIILNYDSHLVAAVGVNDIIVVNTGDATLVCPSNKGHKIKNLLSDLKDEHLEISVGDILIDGSNVGVVDTDVIKERSQLAEEGVIFIYCALDMRLRKVSNEISIKTKGFTHAFTDDELTTIISGLAEKIINNSFKKKSWNLESVKDSVAEEVRKLIVRFTKHRPIIVPVFIEI
jgi:mannose-1-phosphate guanylyltransferase